MAIILEATYAKKLGLPNYSSHSFLVTIRTEVRSLRALEGESARLYRLLQNSVDSQVQQVGFMPDGTTYGMHPDSQRRNGNANGQSSRGAGDPRSIGPCSAKQRSFIAGRAKRMGISADQLDTIIDGMFHKDFSQLDRREASALIDELLSQDPDLQPAGAIALPAPTPTRS